MLVTNKTIFGRTEKFPEKIQNHGKIFRIKKIFGRTKKFLTEDFFLCVKSLRIFRKKENFQNEDSEILFVTKTIVCQFHETRIFGVFFRRLYVAPGLDFHRISETQATQFHHQSVSQSGSTSVSPIFFRVLSKLLDLASLFFLQRP